MVPPIEPAVPQDLNGKRRPRFVQDFDAVPVALPVPDGKGAKLLPGKWQRVKDGIGPAVPVVALGHRELPGGLKAHACAHGGAGLPGLLRREEPGGVDGLADRRHGVGGVDVHRGHQALVLAQGEIPGGRLAGAGQNVVELVKEQLPPRRFKGGGGAVVPAEPGRHGIQGFGVKEPVLTGPVGLFDLRLGGVAAGEDVVQLPVHHRQPVPVSLQLLEESPDGPEADPGVQGPGCHVQELFQIAAGGSAAVVADAADLQQLGHPGFPAQLRQKRREAVLDLPQIPVRLPVDQHLRAGGARQR